MQITLKRILGCILIVVGFLLGAAGVRLLLQPEMYRAEARLKLEWDAIVIHYSTATQIELEMIQSEAVLGKVVDLLDLKRRRGKPTPLTSAETLALLRKQLELRVVPNTTLIEIRALSKDPKEAARIANAVADAYVQWRVETGRKLLQGGLESLEQRAREQAEKIKTANEKLERMRNELGLPIETPPSELESQYPEYAKAGRQLEDMKDFLTLLKRKIKLETDDLLVPQSAPVEIIERAVPPVRPVAPNGPIRAAIVMTSLLAGLAVIGMGIRLLRRC